MNPRTDANGHVLRLVGLGVLLALTVVGCSAAPDADGEDPAHVDGDEIAPTMASSLKMADEPLFEEVAPGTYHVEPVPDTPLRVVFTVEGEGWRSWVGTYKEDEEGDADEARMVALTIAAASRVVTDPCLERSWQDPGASVDELATALADLPGFELTAPVTDVVAYGYAGKHLELTVPDLEYSADIGFAECIGGEFHSWEAPTDRSRTLHRYYQGPGEVLELWILDVAGTRLVIETGRFPDAPPADVAELQAILDSIRIEP